jgi:aconitate hydratase
MCLPGVLFGTVTATSEVEHPGLSDTHRAAIDYALANRKQPLIIIAGADYGQGSSRDWAAKGVRLAGVEAIVAEGFERIHRTNLIGMGVLPLEFKAGTTRKTLGLDGTETYDVVGKLTPRADLTLVVNRKNGETVEVAVTCRLDSDEEVSVYEAGGVLQRFAKDFLEGSVA